MSGFDTFFQQISPLLLTLAPIVIPVLLAYLTTAVRSAYEKMPSRARSILANIVQTGVAAAEQTGFGKFNGAEKKLVAMNAIHAELAHYHLYVPDSVIDPVLEEAVFMLNIASGSLVKLPSPAAVKAAPAPATPTKG